VVKNRTVNSADTVAGEPSRAGVERLLSGGAPEEEGLGRLPSVVEALRRVGETAPTEAEVQGFAAEAANLVPATPQRPVSGSSAHGPSAVRGSRRRLALAGVAAGLVLVFTALTGLAFAANAAIPGDPLYGLDLALESIGVGDGGLQERLVEASRLVERGQVQEGLVHAGDAIAGSAAAGDGLQAVGEALRTAADLAANNRALQSPEGRAHIAGQLRSLASSELTAKEFGLAVKKLTAELAPTDPENGGEPGQGIDITYPGNDGNPGPTDSIGGNGGDAGNGSGAGSGNGGGPPR
jgi:hypothetical protein